MLIRSSLQSSKNSLIDDPDVIIDGKKVELQFYLGGDYKVRLASATLAYVIE